MSVLFTSNRSLFRAENLRTVFEAYSGEKDFVQTGTWRSSLDLTPYKVRVADEFISVSPGHSVIVGHGFGACKTGGIDQPHPYYSTKYANLMDHIITTSEEMIPLVAHQCGVKERCVYPLGMPRTDIYFTSKKGDGHTLLAEKRAYLYVPTFRNREETPFPEIDWQMIDEALTDDEVFIVKMHPMTGRIPLKEYRHILQASPNVPSAPFLIDCDVVITDYSSIMFDAHLLKKPLILFEKRPGYLDTRGLYFKYPDEYSSRFCRSEKELIETMKTANGQNEADLRCVKRFAGACDGHSTERVIRLIESLV